MTDQQWIQRCFDLAKHGLGHVSPNPPVGAILVYQDTILGEGYHRKFGGPHAEVEAFNSVPPGKKHLIPQSTLYVSLEPCCITGKTPPCTDRIILEGVRDVRIGITDPNPSVAGKGIELLKENGIKVTFNILPEQGEHLVRSFKTNILQKRPHVILKWAQSKFNIMGIEGQQVWLSHPYTSTWSHRLRAEADAIMVGARTITTDNPELTTREYPGRSPQRVVYDPNGSLNASFKVFNDDGTPVTYFSNAVKDSLPDKTDRQKFTSEHQVKEMLSVLFKKKYWHSFG